MRIRSRNLAALAIVGTGVLAACSPNGYGNSTPAAEAAGVAPPSTTAAPATAAPGSNAAGQSVVTVAKTDLGDVLVDAQGLTLYGFTNDTNGVSSCTGTCAKTWPPVIVSADFKADDSAKTAKLHTVMRDDGTLQLAAGKWPLYTFAGDAKAGDVSGQGSGGTWFVVQPDGALHKDALASPTPPGAPTPAPAPAAAPTTSKAPVTTKAPARPSGY